MLGFRLWRDDGAPGPGRLCEEGPSAPSYSGGGIPLLLACIIHIFRCIEERTRQCVSVPLTDRLPKPLPVSRVPTYFTGTAVMGASETDPTLPWILRPPNT